MCAHRSQRHITRSHFPRSEKESCGCQLLCRKKSLICSADPEVASAGLYCPKLKRRFQGTSHQPPLARPAAGVKGSTESPVESVTCTAASLKGLICSELSSTPTNGQEKRSLEDCYLIETAPHTGRIYIYRCFTCIKNVKLLRRGVGRCSWLFQRCLSGLPNTWQRWRLD